MDRTMVQQKETTKIRKNTEQETKTNDNKRDVGRSQTNKRYAWRKNPILPKEGRGIDGDKKLNYSRRC